MNKSSWFSLRLSQTPKARDNMPENGGSPTDAEAPTGGKPAVGAPTDGVAGATDFMRGDGIHAPEAFAAATPSALAAASATSVAQAAPAASATFAASATPAVQTARPASTGFGPITGCDLSRLSALVRPFARDPFGRLRPPFSAEAAAMSVELAQMAYTLELEPWVAAGWNDFSIQIDDTLQSGMTHGESANGERMQNLISAWKVHRAKAALREINPVSQIMSAFRQRERSDTIKAVCMMHPMEDGRYLLAIGFMGTGKRFYDWISNFRFTTEEGFHKGFYQLCTYFEQGAESIVFPKTAAELGLERLTLGEVLHEMTSQRSRFRLWMAGHSQGGAVMQIFAHRLITDWGVLPQNMVGYGYASPTVATGRLVHDPAAYPLYHILNSDDMVPRMGALLHLGLCLTYQSNDELRRETYALSALPADVAAREALRPFQLQMADTPSILRYGAAFLQCLAEEKGEEGLNTLMSKKWTFAALDRMLSYAGDKAMGWLDRLVENAQNAHAALTGASMDERELNLLRASMRPVIRDTPFRRLLAGLASYCVPPHHITRNQQRDRGPYAYIVLFGLDALRPFVWMNTAVGMPQKRFGERLRPENGEEMLSLSTAQKLSGAGRGRTLAAAQRTMGAGRGRGRGSAVTRAGYRAARVAHGLPACGRPACGFPALAARRAAATQLGKRRTGLSAQRARR